ncbi:MAG TPA: hypothetical protein VKT78_10890 [Fimbriimonadaceae bacterium]|nr:hypothetical protein [Fimbriimonadaceae bacterium]
MTTALLALWSCCVGGDATSMDAARAKHHKAAVHRRHIAAAKKQAPDLASLLGLAGWSLAPAPGLEPKALRERAGPSRIAARILTPTTTETKRSAKKPALKVAPELQLCSLNVADYEIQKFLPLLTQQTGLNIILMTNSQAKVTMHVEKMRLIDVMRHVCALTGFAYIKASDAYVIAPAETLKAAYPAEWTATHPPQPVSPAEAPQPVTQTYVANFMAAPLLIESIKKLIPTGLEMLAAPGAESAGAVAGRTVLLRGPQPTVNAAIDIAKQLDVSPPPVTQTFVSNYIKAGQLVDAIKKLIPAGLDVIAGPGQETPNLSNIDTSSKTGQASVQVTQETVNTGPASRTVILRGPQALVSAAIDLAKQLDLPRSQVSIAVTIHDISDDAVKDLGLSWNFTDLTLNETPAANGIGVGKVTRNPMTFDAAIKALETRDVAHLMASPNVSLLDGEKAFILIGDRINYPVLTGYTANNSPIFSVNTERVGIYLQVAASIASDGYITLTLYPQVSSITGYLNVNGASYPQVSSREAQTTLRVKSGDAIVLGGLLQDQDISNVDKVPILSSIPFFGEMFKHRKKTKSKSQVIITIKPVVVPQSPK